MAKRGHWPHKIACHQRLVNNSFLTSSHTLRVSTPFKNETADRSTIQRGFLARIQTLALKPWIEMSTPDSLDVDGERRVLVVQCHLFTLNLIKIRSLLWNASRITFMQLRGVKNHQLVACEELLLWWTWRSIKKKSRILYMNIFERRLEDVKPLSKRRYVEPCSERRSRRLLEHDLNYL